ncbi:MAG: hypothetical protein ACREX9_08060 [Gammaproteobacteria bacterium]
MQSGTNDIKAGVVEPAPDAGFIEHPERQTKRGDLPFQKVWEKPGKDWNQYQELIVSPVNTQYMHKMNWLHSMRLGQLGRRCQSRHRRAGTVFS